MAERGLDIVVFGATGFVGALTAAHLASVAPEVRIGLAGRSLARLERLRDDLGDPARGWELTGVDARDPVGLRRLASRTRVLVTTVGPYIRYGREVVRACADAGTDYADLTGEVLFVRWALDEVAERARRTGARIVHSCGFDSIPSDLGVWLTAQRAAEDGTGTLGDTTLVVRTMKGGLSGGTIDSARQQAIIARADPEARRLLADPYALSPSRAAEPSGAYGAPRGGRLGGLPRVERDPSSGHWLGPFVMADYNERVVRLSNALTGWSYGRGFRYREVADFGGGPLAPVRAAGMGVGVAALQRGLSWAPTRTVLDRVLPAPGQGPSASQRAAGRFRMEITATATAGGRYLTTVAAERDPGYNGTAIMLGQTALCLALTTSPRSEPAGVLTPATAMGDALVGRLRAQGFTFDVRSLGVARRD